MFVCLRENSTIFVTSGIQLSQYLYIQLFATHTREKYPFTFQAVHFIVPCILVWISFLLLWIHNLMHPDNSQTRQHSLPPLETT